MKLLKYDDAVVFPATLEFVDSHGLFDKNGVFVKYSSKRLYGTTKYAESPNVCSYADIDINYKDINVLYVGYTRNHWGHFLIDEVSKYWPLFTENRKCFDGIVIYTPNNMELRQFILEFIKYCGVSANDVIIVDKPTKFKTIYYGELSYVAGEKMNECYIKTFEYITKNVLEKCTFKMNGYSNKLYLSRSKLRKGINKEYGEKLIEKILIANGYDILHPEEMSLEEQIFRYANADIIISTNGTLAHNILFAKKSVKFLVLKRFWEPEGNMHQNMIGKYFDNMVTINSSVPLASHATSIINVDKKLCNLLETSYNINIKHYFLIRMMGGVELLKFYIMTLLTKIKRMLHERFYINN